MIGEKSIRIAVDRVFKPIELSIIQGIADGEKRVDIAKKLDISPRTVEGRIDSLRREFKCNTVPQLLVFFIKNKLIEI